MQGTGVLSVVPLFALTTLITALNAVYFKRMLNCFRGDSHDYAIFVSIFDIMLWSGFMSCVALLAGWCPAVRDPLFPRSEVLKAAAIDQLGTLLASIGATQIPGQAQVVINQAVLPLTMLMCLARGRRYTLLEIAGAGLVFAGSVAAVEKVAPGNDR
eukprot:5400914-Amphidinium_carterae.1